MLADGQFINISLKIMNFITDIEIVNGIYSNSLA
jgi:hypothetical protein